MSSCSKFTYFSLSIWQESSGCTSCICLQGSHVKLKSTNLIIEIFYALLKWTNVSTNSKIMHITFFIASIVFQLLKITFNTSMSV